MIENETKNAISCKLVASAALVMLCRSSGDQRGLELAKELEAEAHATWRKAGMVGVSTFDLTILTRDGA